MVDLDSSAGGRNLGDSMSEMNNTFRGEGISVKYDRFRIEGEEINMEVLPDDIEIGERLGQGACSTVYLARHRDTGDRFALKMFNVYDRSRRGQLLKEIKTLANVHDCDSLINFYGTFLKDGNIGVILEYMDMGSLEFLLDPKIRLTEIAFAGIAFQLIWGLAYLHFDRRIHRDIKPANVLLNSRGQVKLADFGISRELDDSQAMSSTSVGTFKYMSIERLLGEEYNASSDIWSVGIMLLEIWGKFYPFQTCCSSPIELVQSLEDIRRPDDIPILSSCPSQMKHFVCSMLTKDAVARATSGELVSDPWFSELGIFNLSDASEAVEYWLTREFEPASKSRGSKAAKNRHRAPSYEIGPSTIDSDRKSVV